MKLFKSRCYNGGNRHKYFAIYDEHKNNDITSVKGYSPEATRWLLYYRTLRETRCEWCGRVRKPWDIDEHYKKLREE
jgi:hypothetical protein